MGGRLGRGSKPASSGGTEATLESPSAVTSPQKQQNIGFSYKIVNPEILFLNYKRINGEIGETKRIEEKKNLAQIMEEAHRRKVMQSGEGKMEEKEGEVTTAKSKFSIPEIVDFDRTVVQYIEPEAREPLFLLQGQDHKEWINQARWESWSQKKLLDEKDDNVSLVQIKRSKYAEFVHSFDEDEARRLDQELTFESMDKSMREANGEDGWEKIFSRTIWRVVFLEAIAVGLIVYVSRKIASARHKDSNVEIETIS
jgi:hypothetical protein